MCTFETMDELYDLLGDLSDLGLKSCLVKGEDFGYGPELAGENNGKKLMYITDEAVEWLIAQGYARDNNSYAKRGGRRWNVHFHKQFDDIWQRMYKISYHMSPTTYDGYYKIVGSCGDSGFGAYFKYELKPRSVKALLRNLEAKFLTLTIGAGGSNPKL